MKKNILLLIITLISFIGCKSDKSNTAKKEDEALRKKDSLEIVRKNDSIKKAKASEFLKNVALTDVSLKCRGTNTRAASVFGSGVTIYFTITNKTQKGIKRVYFNGTFNFDGRSYSHSENINYEFRRGLEPGETQEVAMRPGLISEWNDKIKPGDKGKFELKLLKIEDYTGKHWQIE